MINIDINKIMAEATSVVLANDGKEVPESLLENYNRTLEIQKEILSKIVTAEDGTKVNSDFLEDYNLIIKLKELQDAREEEKKVPEEKPEVVSQDDVIIMPAPDEPELLSFNGQKQEPVEEEEKPTDEIINPFKVDDNKTEEFKFDFDKFYADETAK